MQNLKKEYSIALKHKSSGGRGTSILLAVLILSVVLSISLGLNSIIIRQLKTIREIGYSVVALSAADAGIERVLLDRSSPEDISGLLSNGANFEVTLVPDCPSNICIKSIGIYRGVRRAIEIRY